MGSLKTWIMMVNMKMMKNKYKIEKENKKFILYKIKWFFIKDKIGEYPNSIEAYNKILKLETNSSIL